MTATSKSAEIIANARQLTREPAPSSAELKGALKGVLNLFEENYVQAITKAQVDANVAGLKSHIASLERQLGIPGIPK